MAHDSITPRSKEESDLNTTIKDSMRSTHVITSIVDFLCNGYDQASTVELATIAEKGLRALAKMISWIDINIVINNALATIYRAIQDCRSGISSRGAAYECLFELAKKGMDPIAKIQLINGIGLIPALSSITINREADDETFLNELGPVVDMILQELIMCWIKFEEQVIIKSQACEDVSAIAPTVAALIPPCMTILLSIFSHPDDDVYITVLPSLTRLASLLASQQKHSSQLEAHAGSFPGYFVVFKYY